MRHLSPALWGGLFGILAWWAYLSWVLLVGFAWSPAWDGRLWLMGLSGAVAMASILGEGNLCRWPIKTRLWKTATAGSVAALVTMLGDWVWLGLATLLIGGEDVGNDFLVSLQYRIGSFAAAGFALSAGVLVARRWQGWWHLYNHMIAGLISGIGASCVWTLLHSFLRDLGYHLFWAGAASSFVFGLLFGMCAWAIPDGLYAGWLRVLSRNRFGHRVPIDAKKDEARERFVGHYPNGLDLFLPEEDGVMELHLSVFVDNEQTYIVRGLSQGKSRLRRFLEWVKLHYDPRRPAPFEGELRSGDRIQFGNSAEVEFLMLPREEK